MLKKITDDNNTEYLAVSTGFKNRLFKGVNTAELRSSSGYIVEGTELREWRMQGFKEIDGIIYFFGPAVEGRLLSEVRLTAEITGKLINAFTLIEEAGYRSRQFSLNSVLLTRDGRLLFFPPLLFDFINSSTTEEEKAELIYPWNHPDLNGEKARAFTLAALAYKSVTGDSAFIGSKREEFARSITRRHYTSPLLNLPDLKPDIVKLMEDSFSGSASMDRWRRNAADFNSGELSDKSLSTSDINAIRTRAGRIEAKRVAREKTLHFISVNRTKLIVIAAAAAVLLSILSAVISNVTAPTSTAGMSQAEVVRLYYQGMSDMNLEIMEDCVTKKAGKGDLNQVITTTALIRTRQAYENNIILRDVQTWKEEGMPPLDMQTLLWGLDNIRIEELPAADTISVSYEQWLPGGRSADKQSYRPEAFKVTDIVHLTEFRDTWKIDMIDRSAQSIDNGSNE